jgi:protein bicaudal D
MLASREIEQLRADLQELEKGLNCSDATLQLRTEVTNLKNKVRVFHQSEMFTF